MTYIEPKLPSRFGDNYCDDDNNNEECAYDGGDCCGDHAGNMYWNFYCSVCECLDPNGESPTGSAGPPTNTCGLQWICN